MINLDLRDKNIVENVNAILYLKKTKQFTDEEIQEMYSEEQEMCKDE